MFIAILAINLPLGNVCEARKDETMICMKLIIKFKAIAYKYCISMRMTLMCASVLIYLLIGFEAILTPWVML